MRIAIKMHRYQKLFLIEVNVFAIYSPLSRFSEWIPFKMHCTNKQISRSAIRLLVHSRRCNEIKLYF